MRIIPAPGVPELPLVCPSCHAETSDESEVCFHCRTVLSAVTLGSVIGGRYEILDRIGKGGMGVVFRAHDRMLEEDVALKVLRSEMAESPELARRFRSEIKLARRVTHPNVCRIHDYGEEGRVRYISMELLRGRDLKHVVREDGPLPPAEVMAAGIAIADALQAIHDVGIVHRDLKTSNIMRSSDGRIRVMDFGIAKIFGAAATTGATAAGQVLGTPDYMSPEQASGTEIDSRSDVYSLGVVLYELAVGRVPFQADTPVGVLMHHLHTPPPLDEPHSPQLPDRLNRILRRCLAKDPLERYATAGEVGRDLREASSRLMMTTTETVQQVTAASDATELVPRPGVPPPLAPRAKAALAALLGIALAGVLLAAALARPRDTVRAVATAAPTSLTDAPTAPPGAVTTPSAPDDIAFLGSAPPPGSVIALGPAARGGLVLRVTASVEFSRSGKFKLFVQDRWPNTCISGSSELLSLVAGQKKTAVIDVRYPDPDYPPCAVPFRISQLQIDLYDPELPSSECCLIPDQDFIAAYTFVP